MLTMFYTPRNINILIIYYFLNFKIILTLHFFILFFIFNFFIINMITHIIIVKNEATAWEMKRLQSQKLTEIAPYKKKIAKIRDMKGTHSHILHSHLLFLSSFTSHTLSNHKSSHFVAHLRILFYFPTSVYNWHKNIVTQKHTKKTLLSGLYGSLRPISPLSCSWILVLIKNTVPFE